jgi:hypothetical protein
MLLQVCIASLVAAGDGHIRCPCIAVYSELSAAALCVIQNCHCGGCGRLHLFSAPQQPQDSDSSPPNNSSDTLARVHACLQIVRNGSHSTHALSVNAGMTVNSPEGAEQLHIHSIDAPLVSLGEPNVMPNPCVGPDMGQGVSWCLTNNIWGTNYPMFVPWSDAEVNMAFRFTLSADLSASAQAAGPGGSGAVKGTAGGSTEVSAASGGLAVS